MHSTSPVHVRIENHVKNPMTTKSMLGSDKLKKKVQIGYGSSANVFKNMPIDRHQQPQQQQRKSRRNDLETINQVKSKSLSPSKSRAHWCPPPGKTTKSTPINNQPTRNSQLDLMRTCRLSEYDHIPVKESKSQPDETNNKSKHAGLCSVCKPRSRSRTPPRPASPLSSIEYEPDNSIDNISSARSDSFLNSNFNNNNNTMNDRHQGLRRICSLSPIPTDRREQHDGTYSKSTPSRSKSWNNLSPTNRLQSENDDTDQKLRALMDTVSQSETCANDIAKQLSSLKEFLQFDLLGNPRTVVIQLEKQRTQLLRNIDKFHMANLDVRSLAYDLNSSTSFNSLRHQQENELLVKQIETLELENQNYKKMLFQLETNINRSGTANQALNIENNVLTNIKQCLEDNRAHLRRQLSTKEAEINRLNVQIRNLNRKLDRSQIEIELLRENRQKAGLAPLKLNQPSKTTSSHGSTTTKSTTQVASGRDIKLTKRYYNLEEVLADPMKTRLYIEKLNKQLKEKDELVKNLNETLIKREVQKIDTASSVELIEKYRDENERFKNDINTLKRELMKAQESKVNMATSPIKTPHHGAETKSFNEIELENVRSRLQQRLNELEPLPEMLKNAELKLVDSSNRIEYLESEIADYKKLANDLRQQLEKSVKQLPSSSRLDNYHHQPLKNIDTYIREEQEKRNREEPLIKNITINKMDPFEKRMHNLEEENRELLRQLSVKDDLIRDLTNKLAVKSNEASSYSRQLDMALGDARLKEQQIKDKFSAKEKALQARCNELESKLNALELHSNVDRKDKNEMAHDYITQIRDLKAKLEQTQVTYKQMQEYVNFLKNSYISYFNDQTLNTFDAGAGSTNNFIGSSRNPFY